MQMEANSQTRGLGKAKKNNKQDIYIYKKRKVSPLLKEHYLPFSVSCFQPKPGPFESIPSEQSGSSALCHPPESFRG